MGEGGFKYLVVRELRPLVYNPDQHYSLAGETQGQDPLLVPYKTPLVAAVPFTRGWMTSATKVSKDLGLDFGLKSEEESLNSGDIARSIKRRDIAAHQLCKMEATLNCHLNGLNIDLSNPKDPKHFLCVYGPSPICGGTHGGLRA